MRKRSKVAYVKLYDDPTRLFPGCSVVLYPNGEPEIWIKTADGLGLRLRASNGPYGLGLTVQRFICGGKLTTCGDAEPCGAEYTDLQVTQYRTDTKSQAFKAAYHSHAPGALDKFHSDFE